MIRYKNDRLAVEDVSAEALARRFGTPLYVYSQAEILARYAALRKAFAGALICYALKANSNRAVCGLLRARGAGADIVSGGELARALACGFPASRIVFSGVGKTEEELSSGLKAGVLTFNVESFEELRALEKVARRLRRPAPVSVRLNPDVDAGTHPHITTGRADNKFGVEEGEALAMFERADQSPWLRVKGLQFHIGSQIETLAPYARAAASAARLVARLEEKGIKLELLDFGGGFGVSYRGEKTLEVGALARTLRKALAPWPQARLLIEPGRWLVADAGALLTRVLYKKTTSRRRFVVVDAGMNDLARPALYGAWHPVVAARRRRGKTMKADVVGPICETGDYLARQRALPPLEAGDLLAVLKAGAYGFSMSSQYNSRPRAAEVLVAGRKARLIRRRETIEDLVRAER